MLKEFDEFIQKPIIIIGTHKDLEEPRKVTIDLIEDFISRYRVPIYEVQIYDIPQITEILDRFLTEDEY